jgi:hypothetical protein
MGLYASLCSYVSLYYRCLVLTSICICFALIDCRHLVYTLAFLPIREEVHIAFACSGYVASTDAIERCLNLVAARPGRANDGLHQR